MHPQELKWNCCKHHTTQVFIVTFQNHGFCDHQDGPFFHGDAYSGDPGPCLCPDPDPDPCPCPCPCPDPCPCPSLDPCHGPCDDPCPCPSLYLCPCPWISRSHHHVESCQPADIVHISKETGLKRKKAAVFDE